MIFNLSRMHNGIVRSRNASKLQTKLTKVATNFLKQKWKSALTFRKLVPGRVSEMVRA